MTPFGPRKLRLSALQLTANKSAISCSENRPVTSLGRNGLWPFIPIVSNQASRKKGPRAAPTKLTLPIESICVLLARGPLYFFSLGPAAIENHRKDK